MELYFFSLFSRAVGREGGMLQTNNTGVRSQCLSHTGSAPAHCACSLPPCPHRSGSRLFRREQSEAGPGLHVPPRSKPLRFRHSGSHQSRRLSGACVLCSSQVRAALVMRCLASANAVTYRLPATRLSGRKTGAPSQANVDSPDSQEVFLSKEACLQSYR